MTGRLLERSKDSLPGIKDEPELKNNFRSIKRSEKGYNEREVSK